MALKAKLERLSAMPQESGARRMAGAARGGGEVWTLTFVERAAATTRAAPRAAPHAAATLAHLFANTTAAAVAASAATATAAVGPAAASPAAAAARTHAAAARAADQSPARPAPAEIADGPPVLGPLPNDGVIDEHDPEWEAGPERPTATVFGFQNAEVRLMVRSIGIVTRARVCPSRCSPHTPLLSLSPRTQALRTTPQLRQALAAPATLAAGDAGVLND